MKDNAENDPASAILDSFATEIDAVLSRYAKHEIVYGMIVLIPRTIPSPDSDHIVFSSSNLDKDDFINLLGMTADLIDTSEPFKSADMPFSQSQ